MRARRRVETRRDATSRRGFDRIIDIIENHRNHRAVDRRATPNARARDPDAYLEFFLSLGVDFLPVRGVVGHDVEAWKCDDDRASSQIHANLAPREPPNPILVVATSRGTFEAALFLDDTRARASTVVDLARHGSSRWVTHSSIHLHPSR